MERGFFSFFPPPPKGRGRIKEGEGGKQCGEIVQILKFLQEIANALQIKI